MREVLAYSAQIIPENRQPRIGYQAILGQLSMSQRADISLLPTKRYGVLNIRNSH